MSRSRRLGTRDASLRAVGRSGLKQVTSPRKSARLWCPPSAARFCGNYRFLDSGFTALTGLCFCLPGSTVGCPEGPGATSCGPRTKRSRDTRSALLPLVHVFQICEGSVESSIMERFAKFPASLIDKPTILSTNRTLAQVFSRPRSVLSVAKCREKRSHGSCVLDHDGALPLPFTWRRNASPFVTARGEFRNEQGSDSPGFSPDRC